MRDAIKLAKIVNSIPHLPLHQFKYDAKRIEQEIKECVFPLMPYTATMQSTHGHTKSKWNNLSLYSHNGEIFADRMEGAGPNELERIWGHFQRTGLDEYLPYTYEVIDSLGAGKALARIEEIHEQAVMGWHNHVFELYHPETMMIIQLPIVIPEGFKYSVISNKEYATTDFTEGMPKVYESSYIPGTPVIFNAYHFHNVFNYSKTQSRLTIRFFADLRDDAVYDFVQQAVDEYEGEYIE
jgi:hypothetical protein